jgi:hypothetical protein
MADDDELVAILGKLLSKVNPHGLFVVKDLLVTGFVLRISSASRGVSPTRPGIPRTVLARS